VQITRTTPLRRMILHLRQIFFTDASTFISFSPPLYPAARAAPPEPPAYLIPDL